MGRRRALPHRPSNSGADSDPGDSVQLLGQSRSYGDERLDTRGVTALFLASSPPRAEDRERTMCNRFRWFRLLQRFWIAATLGLIIATQGSGPAAAQQQSIDDIIKKGAL